MCINNALVFGSLLIMVATGCEGKRAIVADSTSKSDSHFVRQGDPPEQLFSDADKEADYSDLIGKLKTSRLEGTSFGGPYITVVHNELTREIVARGRAIVPSLAKSLNHSSYEESVLIVFCLIEIGDTSCKEQLDLLKAKCLSGDRFAARHDRTLVMYVDRYLAIADKMLEKGKK